MDAQEGILDEFRFGPFTRLDTVVGFNVSIDCKISQYTVFSMYP
jgi:hypothetical protein